MAKRPELMVMSGELDFAIVISEQDNPVRLQLAHAVREKNEAVRSAVQIGTDDHPHERFSFTRVPASQEARSMASSMSMTGISSRMG